jgi:hypothetical protein
MYNLNDTYTYMKEMKTEFRSREVASPASYSGGLIMVPRPTNLIEVFCRSPQSVKGKCMESN